MSDPFTGLPQTPQVEAKPPRDRGRDARLVLTGVLGVLLVWFAIANLQDVPIHFWVTSTRASLIVVIIISGALGALVAQLAGRARRRHRPDAESPT